MTVSVQPMQWSKTDDIDDVSAFDDNDKTCLSEVREVLRRHNMVERFGMTLVHSHFAIAEDEVMLEDTDIETRTLRIRPVKIGSEEVSDSRPTNWKFTEDSNVVAVACTCRRVQGNHTGTHGV